MYLIIGMGCIGQAVARALHEQGLPVLGISRHHKALRFAHIACGEQGITLEAIKDYATQIRHILVVVSPSTTPESATIASTASQRSSVVAYLESYYRVSESVVALSHALPNLERVVFVSSTGVYGQNHGEIIDINTPIEVPQSPTAQVLMDSETLLRAHFGERLTIVRPSGIYGLHRRRLITLSEQLLRGKLQTLPSNTWTNRIMDTDLIAVLVTILQLPLPLPVYLVTDNEPVPLYAVLHYLSQMLSNTIESTVPTGQYPLLDNRSDTSLISLLNTNAKSPITGKRIVNNLPDTWLAFPTWRVGYDWILAQMETDNSL